LTHQTHPGHHTRGPHDTTNGFRKTSDSTTPTPTQHTHHTTNCHPTPSPTSTIHNTLKQLHFNTNADNPPSTFGIPWTEGPIPNKKTIHDRWKTFKLLHDHALTTTKTATTASKQRLQEIYDKMATTYDTLTHNLTKHVEQRLKKDPTQKPARELETSFRKALHHNLPNHWLALHTSDTQQTHKVEYELPTATVSEIESYMKGEQPTDNFPDTFRSSSPTAIWIPGNNLGARNWIKRIQTIIKESPHSELIAIATLDITSELGDRTPPKTSWTNGCRKNPPSELTHITPASPHIRLRKCHRTERPHTDHNAMAYILHFNAHHHHQHNQKRTDNHSFPDLKDHGSGWHSI
jgi:hypothetical protein